MEITTYEQKVLAKLIDTRLGGKSKGLKKLVPTQRQDDGTIIMLDPSIETINGAPRDYWEFNAANQTLWYRINQGVKRGM